MSGQSAIITKPSASNRNASTDDIERAFRKLARQHHPDRNIGDKDAEARFKELTEAHAILIDENKRERYDRYGHTGLEGCTSRASARPLRSPTS